MAKTQILILFTWTLLQAFGVCDSCVKAENTVGFSASLTEKVEVDFHGHWGVQKLVFKNATINNGNAYNPDTGIFTAPRKGTFQFTYTTWCRSDSVNWHGARLVKNGDDQIQVSTRHAKGKAEPGSTSAALILSLEAGDQVYVCTWGHDRQVYDGPQYHINTFSGFLLFPQ